ncbi:MAG: hypothetical protein AAF489_14155 [Bacteroidota bacterium]
MFTWLLFILLSRGISFLETTDILWKLLGNGAFQLFVHLVFVLVLGLFYLILYFIRIFRVKGFLFFLKRLCLLVLLPLFILVGGYKSLVHWNTQEDFSFVWDTSVENRTGVSNNLFKDDGKHRGMSVFGWRNEREEAVKDLVKTNIEWVAVIPFLDQKDEQSTEVRLRETYAHWSKRDSVFLKTISQLHDKGIHVQLKPHLWLQSGWRSNINFETSADWDVWFDSYRVNMLHYARMAQETGVALFCVGTELKTSIAQQPEKWDQLISEIKSIYNGRLTYAANWDGDYNEISFWDQMDYIGIQAYFPLTDTENPDLETIKNGWNEHLHLLKGLSEKHQRPILFTEVGYKSESSSTIKPWEWEHGLGVLYKEKSDRTQMLAYEALFQKLWEQDWFAGLYIWQWNTQSRPERASKSLSFSPRYKPAENVIAKWFGRPISSRFPLEFIPID